VASRASGSPGVGLYREQVDEYVYRLSLPYFFGFVNVYLVLGSDGPRLIDTGANDETARLQLEGHLASFGYRPEDIVEILITHTHGDHVGNSAELARRSGANILIAKEEATVINGRFWSRLDPAWLHRHGLDLDGAANQRDSSSPPGIFDRTDPAPEVMQFVRNGDELEFGRVRLQVSTHRGHSRALVCAFEPDREYLFSSDQVMQIPTPLRLGNPGDDDPIGLYFNSLDQLDRLSPKRVLPGHGASFDTFHRAIERSRKVHLDRIEQVSDLLHEGPLDAAQLMVATGYGWYPAAEPPGPVRAAYSIARVSSYLEHLVALGRASTETRGDRIYYRSLNPSR
jgi:glyoxylase-like metal-dependent hydrolase (beta-lactamase superfamily II)